MSSRTTDVTAVYERCPFCERVFDLAADETGALATFASHTPSRTRAGKREAKQSRRTAR